MNFGADYLEPGVIHYGGRGAVVVGEIDGRMTPRVTAIRDAWRDFDDRAIVTPNIWGYLWGKEAYGAMLFATALTNESIADALAMPRVSRSVHRARARDARGRAARAASAPEAFDGFDPARIPAPTRPPAPPRARSTSSSRYNRRSAKTHSGIWRDLAVRKRPHRSRCAARDRRGARRARPACRRRSPRGSSS